jgi:hypothetical protein
MAIPTIGAVGVDLGRVTAARRVCASGTPRAGVEGTCGAWRGAPDLVLFEAFALAGPLVAELLGVPGVAHLFGPLPRAR